MRALARKRLEQMVRLIPLFEPKTVVCHSGYDHKRYWHMREEWADRSLATWDWLARVLRNEGALLMLENVYERGPDDMRPFLNGFRRMPSVFAWTRAIRMCSAKPLWKNGSIPWDHTSSSCISMITAGWRMSIWRPGEGG